MREISVDVELTTKELYRFSMRHTYTNISGIFGLVISIGSLIICALRYKSLDTTAIAALIVIGLIFTVIQPLMLLSKAQTQVKRNKNINGKLNYTFGDEGITVTQGEQQADVKWYELRKKVVTSNAMYVYMSPVRAFVFPKSQCGDSFSELVSLIDKKMEEYKDYEPFEAQKNKEQDKHDEE